MKNSITTIVNFLSGKKTYIIGLLMISLGYLTADNALILEGFAIMALRSGISSSKK